MDEIYYFIFGILLIIYGFVKLSLLSIEITKSFYPNKFNYQNFPFIGSLFNNISDSTLAGRFNLYILVLFSIVTFFLGLSYTNILNIPFFRNNFFHIFINASLGLALLIFYFIILYTNIPIHKNIKQFEDDYKLYGIALGLTFIIFIPFILFYYFFKLNLFAIFEPIGSILFIFIIILLLLILFIIINVHKLNSPYKILDFIIIPISNIG